MIPVTVSLKPELVEAMKALSNEEHRSLSKQVAFFCDQGIRDHKKKQVAQYKEADAE
tara:strand:+ start:328 stop:498 length:171 start_codon:yes stop_codon:yes gene_type:complete